MDDKAQVLVDNMDIITFKQLLEYLRVDLGKLRKWSSMHSPSPARR
jgi:hypothetical protein